jgi:hypothetical protein
MTWMLTRAIVRKEKISTENNLTEVRVGRPRLRTCEGLIHMPSRGKSRKTERIKDDMHGFVFGR